MEGPIFPDIKRDFPKFRSAGKYWKVDAGTSLKEVEKYPFFNDGIIELQSRDRNKTMYGQSSHRSYVNHHVRYPLFAPVDYLPENRKPRRPVVPRVNPDFIFRTQNDQITEVYSYLTDRIKPGNLF